MMTVVPPRRANQVVSFLLMVRAEDGVYGGRSGVLPDSRPAGFLFLVWYGQDTLKWAQIVPIIPTAGHPHH